MLNFSILKVEKNINCEPEPIHSSFKVETQIFFTIKRERKVLLPMTDSRVRVTITLLS